MFYFFGCHISLLQIRLSTQNFNGLPSLVISKQYILVLSGIRQLFRHKHLCVNGNVFDLSLTVEMAHLGKRDPGK